MTNMKLVIFDNPRSRYLRDQIAWATRWIALPEAELPGTLTHAKCQDVLDAARDELLEHYGLQVIA